jgi:hypothetical protein
MAGDNSLLAYCYVKRSLFRPQGVMLARGVAGIHKLPRSEHEGAPSRPPKALGRFAGEYPPPRFPSLLLLEIALKSRRHRYVNRSADRRLTKQSNALIYKEIYRQKD